MRGKSQEISPRPTLEEIRKSDWLLQESRVDDGGLFLCLGALSGLLFLGGLLAMGGLAFSAGVFSLATLISLVCLSGFLGSLCLILLGWSVLAPPHAFSVRLRARHEQRSLRRRERRWERELPRLQRQLGWRPIQGAPHPAGRTDTHPRFLVEARAHPHGIKLQLTAWEYGAEKGWQPAGQIREVECGRDQECLMEARAQLEREGQEKEEEELRGEVKKQAELHEEELAAACARMMEEAEAEAVLATRAEEERELELLVREINSTPLS